MCNIVSQVQLAGISRRRLMGSFAIGAAAVTAAACGSSSNNNTSGTTTKTDQARSFGPASYEGQRTRLVLLGTNGGPTPYWPITERQGIASAVVVGDQDYSYLVDAGHGVVGRLRQAKLGERYDTDIQGDLDVLRGIFLTHLHSDHVVDLNTILTEGMFNGLQFVDRIPIWGPGNRGALPPWTRNGPPPVPVAPGNPTPGTREMTDLMVQAYATDFNDRMFDNGAPRPEQLWEAKDVPVPAQYLANPNTDPCPEMDPFAFFEDDNVKVSASLVYHAPVFPALAYRFDTADGSVVFSGDTGPTPNLIKLASNADVLVHEVIDKSWAESVFPEPRTPAQEGLYQHWITSHTVIEEVGPIAQKAGVKTLVLSHLVPGNRPDEVWQAAGNGFDGQLVIGHDLDVIGIGQPA